MRNRIQKTSTPNCLVAKILAALAITTIAAPAFADIPITVLTSFSFLTGSNPEASLILSGNTFYGTTQQGGANGSGTVFSVPITGGTPTVLASFNGSLSGPGARPYAGVTLLNNTLYGVTMQGGANNLGTIYSVPTAGGIPTALASLDFTTGANPDGTLTLIGNTLYGTTSSGGANGLGTIFSIPITGGTPTVLTSFDSTSGGVSASNLTLVGNTFYGVTERGGANNLGTVFSIPITGGTATVLASFSSTSGSNPVSGLTLSGNIFYGTMSSGGANNLGTVFSVPITGGTPTVLASFGTTTGTTPIGGLTLLGNTLYGTTFQGSPQGTAGFGTIFSLPITGGTPTVLASFNDTNGRNPRSTLLLSGNTLYGTTEGGGASGHGTIYSITPTPEPTTLSLLTLSTLPLPLPLLLRRRRRGR